MERALLCPSIKRYMTRLCLKCWLTCPETCDVTRKWKWGHRQHYDILAIVFNHFTNKKIYGSVVNLRLWVFMCDCVEGRKEIERKQLQFQGWKTLHVCGKEFSYKASDFPLTGLQTNQINLNYNPDLHCRFLPQWNLTWTQNKLLQMIWLPHSSAVCVCFIPCASWCMMSELIVHSKPEMFKFSTMLVLVICLIKAVLKQVFAAAGL